jgi:large subunit ribosomal protein L18
VFRSNKHIYAQVIDDTKGHTLAAASDGEVSVAKATKTKIALAVGELLAQKVQKAGIKKVVFDRGPYKYHGRVKALAEGLRKGGLEL